MKKNKDFKDAILRGFEKVINNKIKMKINFEFSQHY